jgi:hypothetical protein
MNLNPAVRRHWPKLLAILAAAAFAAVVVREIPPTIRYVKMERM